MKTPPSTALHGLASYVEQGVLHHVGPFGVAVEGSAGWAVARVPAPLDEAEAVHIVATGVPREPEYGAVLVIAGKHRGKLGYYDDDDDDAGVGCVYFGVPFKEPWEEVPLRYLVGVDVELIGLERLRREAPHVYEVMRLPLREAAPFIPRFMQEQEAFRSERSRITTLDEWYAFKRKWFDQRDWPMKSGDPLAREVERKQHPLFLGGRTWSQPVWAYHLSSEARHEYFSTLADVAMPLQAPALFGEANRSGPRWQQECYRCAIATSEIGDATCPRCGGRLFSTYVED